MTITWSEGHIKIFSLFIFCSIHKSIKTKDTPWDAVLKVSVA